MAEGTTDVTIATLSAIITGTASAGTLFGLFIAGGVWIETSTRKKSPETKDNDLLELDCQKLCAQISARQNEECLTKLDAEEKFRRSAIAAGAAAAASVAAAAASAAAVAASASILGLAVAPFLWIIAITTGAAATSAAAFAASAFQNWVKANTSYEAAKSKNLQARDMMLQRCGADRTNACIAQVPPCP
jgi:hypothetical protein